MDDIKVTVSFSIPGSIMLKENDPNGDPVEFVSSSLSVSNRNSKKSETITFKTPKCKPCTQSINMTREAYKSMLNTPIHKISPFQWNSMSKKKKIAEHLKDIQHDLHATSFEFIIYED
jgi:hypothetical protein